MQTTEYPSAFLPALCARFGTLVWSCLDNDLPRSAVFYAERYFALDQENHDSRHLYATALLHAGQTHSALCAVNPPREKRCPGCDEVRARCLTKLGRHRDAHEALQECMASPLYTPSPAMARRSAVGFPEQAVLHCRDGAMALNGKLYDSATTSFRRALSLNPMVWDAFEGLCTLGTIPEIDELFPPRPSPVKRTVPEDNGPHAFGGFPTATGAGFFTPAQPNGGIFRGWRPDGGPSQPFRMDPPGTGDTSFQPENSFLQTSIRPSRFPNTFMPPPPPPTFGVQPSTTLHPAPPPQPALHPPIARPLSSAEETGPVPKKLRSTSRAATKAAAAGEDATKKARARPALHISNFFSSNGRQPKVAPATRATGGGAGKAEQPTRRSNRLLGGAGARAAVRSPPRDRRKNATHVRTRSNESEVEDEQVAFSPSPPAAAHSPASDESPLPTAPSWSKEDEAAATEEYCAALADYYIYELMRTFARATRALALYDTQTCLDLLDTLPSVHQRSPWVMSMVGKAHYERTEYASAERAFQAVRSLEPYRVWDMEVYSTLLWYLQKPVQLSFLAQELLAINARSPQAWIAVGNTFSAQKERSQALTCFRRAMQLDPSCAYAYTLSGHESVDEDPDQAMNFFQSALRADPRHYNAWYGLGSMYMKRNKMRLAEYHYQRALDINPNNAVILGCMGMAVQRRGDKAAAMEFFDKAIHLAPDNALVRYNRAKLFISMQQYKLAVTDLEHLRDTTPDESNVVFQLAKVYRLLGDELKAAQLLAAARDISPLSTAKIRKLLETVKDEGADGADEDMTDA